MSYILENEEDYCFFKLSRAKGVSLSLIHKVLKNNDIISVVKNADFIFKKISFPSDEELKQELEEIDKIGATLITYNSEFYPDLLKIIDNFPLTLTCKGNINLLKNERKVAIIGSRNCSINSFNFCKKIAKEVSSYGYTIVSGMAKGIDASAHVGSIENGTIAVLGSGINVIYPKENEYLYYDIINNNGLIITEFSLNTSPKAENFPTRNRIIAGLSRGIIVMEAAKVSGTMHTVNQATKYGREVMIFPGNPYDDRCEGSNKLLQDGATMVIDTKDIIENLESFIPDNCFRDSKTLYYSYDDNDDGANIIDYDDKQYNSIDDVILSKLDYTPLLINELIDNMSEYDLNSINSTITKLQLDKKIIVELGKISLRF